MHHKTEVKEAETKLLGLGWCLNIATTWAGYGSFGAIGDIRRGYEL